MTHLSPSEFVDFVDRTLPVARSAHVASCAACRRQAEDVRGALRAARGSEVPEPSPLFWDHLSARIRNEIAGVRTPQARWWLRPVPVLSWSIGALLVAVLVVRQLPQRVQSPVSPEGSVAADVQSNAADDPAWDLLVSAADDLPLEDVHASGLGVRAATVDSAVQELSPTEREELGRLLQDELKHSGA
jgi:hypothetical protein